MINSIKNNKYIFSLAKILSIVEPEKKQLLSIAPFFFILPILDLVSLSAVIPFISYSVGEEIDFNHFDFLVNTSLSKEMSIIYFGIALIFLFSLKTLLTLYFHRRIIKVSAALDVRLKNTLCRSYFARPLIKSTEIHSSENIINLTEAAEDFANVFILTLLRVISELIIFLSILAYLIWVIGVSVFLLSIFLLSAALIFHNFIGYKSKNYGVIANQVRGKIIKNLNEGLLGIRELKIYSIKNFFLDNINKASKSYARSKVNSRFIQILPRYLFEYIFVFIIVVSVIFYSSLFTVKQITPILGLIGFAALRVLPIFSSFTSNLSKLEHSYDSFKRVYRDIKESDNYKSSVTSKKYKLSKSSLHIRNLSFVFDDNSPKILDNLNLNIKFGEIIGIFGESGSGKTTLINIMLGLLRPSSGKVCYGDKDLFKLKSNWYEECAYIPQEPFLIEGSIRDNIALGVQADLVDYQLLEKCIKDTALDGFISGLKEGYFSEIGESGSRLSGGQKQRISIARALYFQRNIFFLDEPTSALDQKNEKEIIKLILNFKDKKTIVIISHNKDSLKLCHRLFNLENGKLKELT